MVLHIKVILMKLEQYNYLLIMIVQKYIIFLLKIKYVFLIIYYSINNQIIT